VTGERATDTTKPAERTRYLLPCSCALTLSSGIVEACSQAREQEIRAAQSLADIDAEALLRELTTCDVPAASTRACSASASREEFWDWCLSLKGEPWSEARARRGMRERVRIWQHAILRGAWVPRTQGDLLTLWAHATKGEFPLYRECETPQFRVKGVPFAHGPNPFEPAPLLPGYQTTPPEEIPAQVDMLLELVAEDALPLEVRAAAAHFALGAIHPFRDGNGHCARMLMCAMLAPAYSLPTLLALDANIQKSRTEIEALFRSTTGKHQDAEGMCAFLLTLLLDAQTRILHSGKSIHLRYY